MAAVDLAEKYLASGSCKTVLVISSEMLTKITDYTDRSTCVLFGDGAGAAVLRFADAMYETDIGSDPTGCGKLFARGVPPANPFREKAFDWAYDGLPETNGFGLHQDGRDVYKFATRAMPAAVESACQKAGIRVDELDWIFPIRPISGFWRQRPKTSECRWTSFMSTLPITAIFPAPASRFVWRRPAVPAR